jgi:hypothetical protein
MNIGPNELLVAFCGAGQNSAATVPVVANYNSTSFSIVTALAESYYNAAQMSYLVLGASTPVTTSTFTCTPSSDSGYQSMIVLEFLSPTVTLNTSSTNSNSSNVSSYTSGSFTSTAAPTINIFCVNGHVGVASAGDMAGSQSTLAAVDQPSLTDSAYAACEWNTSTTIVSSATGAMTSSNGTSYTAILGAFSY